MHDGDQIRGFHESYYAHSCPIIPEQDVLHTDIKGRHCFAAVRRWWNDLFLLSATTESSRGFYNSSHAMRIERFKQFRKHRSRIHPMSKFTNFWNTVILLAFFINKILFRFTSAIIIEDMPMFYYYFGAFLEFIIVMDLYVNLKTGYIVETAKKVVLDTEMSMMNYCSKKLFLHFISAIPLHWFMFLKYGWNIQCGLCKFNKFICVLKILGVPGLYRIFEMSSYWTKKRFSPPRLQMIRLFRIGMVGLVTMLQFYEIVDVVWELSMFHTQKLDTHYYVGKLIRLRYGIYQNFPNYLILCFDIARIFKSLLLFSFNPKYTTYSLDKLSSVIAYIIANSFYAWSIMECYSIISRAVYPSDKLVTAKHSVQNLIISRQLSDQLMYKVEEYFNFKLTRLKLLEINNGLYRNLPEVLKKEAMLCCYTKLLMRVPLFADWPISILEELALLLKQEVYITNDVVAPSWTEGRGLVIVDGGVLAVYSIYMVETGHLIDGDFFGQVSLFTDLEANLSHVVAASTCRILILDKTVFRKFMRKEPKLFNEMKENIEKKFRYDNDVPESPISYIPVARRYALSQDLYSHQRMYLN